MMMGYCVVIVMAKPGYKWHDTFYKWAVVSTQNWHFGPELWRLSNSVNFSHVFTFFCNDLVNYDYL